MWTEPFRKNPILKLTRLLKSQRVFKKKNINIIAGAYAKLFICEPFRIIENVRYSPERIARHQIENPPIFVIGHWRSGTSYFQYLLTKDPNFGYFNRYQVVFPLSFLTTESVFKPLFEKIIKKLPLARAFKTISIDIELDEPGELDIALIFLVSPVNLHWGHAFPGKAEKFFNRYLLFEKADRSEIALWKSTYRFLINKLSIKNGNRQIVIKSPGNTARIPQLLELYPDANFIYIHRNPFDLFYSNRKLWNIILSKIAVQDISPGRRDDIIIQFYKKVIGRYLKYRHLIPEGNLTEVRFESFVEDPLETMRYIYRELSLNDIDRAIEKAMPFVQEQKRDQASSYQYEEGIIERLSNEWKQSLKVWPYETPLRNVAKTKNRQNKF